MGIARCVGCLALRQVSTATSSHGHNSAPLLALQMKLSLDKRWNSHTSWTLPEVHDTGITVFNSATRSKVPLRTVHPGLVTWYSCGPTVYDSAHIGHALCYVKLDIIRRILARMFNLNVVMVMGITDIDDKIIMRSKELGVSCREVSERYEEEFFADMDRLRVWRPSLAPRVTEHVPHVIAFTQQVLSKRLAYVVSDGSVYFDTKEYGRYGRLFRVPETEEVHKDGIKKSPRDFALWKGAKPNEPYWESPWGRGRPGWHIECSAMASHILGAPLDIHTGGIDLIFPHHENEEAQCCAYHNSHQWCNYWLHTGHLHTKGTEKMSKSLYNTISVEQLLHQHSVNTFRLFCLLSHYRSKVEYTSNSMVTAQAFLRRIRSFLQDAYSYMNGQLKCAPLDEPALKKKLAETRIKVKKSLADDFDTIRALDAVMELINLGNRELQRKSEASSLSRSAGSMVAICSYIHYLMDDVFGIQFPSVSDASNMTIESGGRLSHVMNAVVKWRQDVRSFALLRDSSTNPENLTAEEKKAKRREREALLLACDHLRDDLQEIGLHIKDHQGGTSWSVADSADNAQKQKRR